MSIFKNRKNKRFNYKPHYYKKDGEGSPFELKHKFDTYRKTVDAPKGIKKKLSVALSELKEHTDKQVNKRLLIIIAVLVFLFLYSIDFELSIFFPKK